ncbi:glycosyltransferase [Parvularcula oceani]|uniref:glycosyltransferase n=1 Tax=Parvularcula oceani TaxID=1247963 RepID=UPI00068EA69A|nr:glycosyltransferase [Parvularcula oceani]
MAKTVLHVITGLNIGGAEHMLLRHAAGLDPSAWRSEILSLLPPGPLAANAAALGVRVHSALMPQGRFTLRAALRIAGIARAVRPDIVHGWMYHGNLAASLAGAAGRAPCLWSIHHSLADISREKASTRAVIRLSAAMSGSPAAISYCSRAARGQHEALGFRAKTAIVIPNGTDTDAFRPAPGAGERLRELLGVPPARQLVGHVGRAHPMKDTGSFVAAIARLLEEGRDVQGVVIGAGHDEGGSAVRAAASAHGIGGRISVLGPRGDVAALLPGLDLYVQSSAWGEAFSLAISEAMACGVPPVVTDVGDSAWLVGDAGATVPPSDPQALARACARILDLPAQGRARLSAAARARVAGEFGLDRYVARHVQAYERAMSGRGQRAAAAARPPLRGAR